MIFIFCKGSDKELQAIPPVFPLAIVYVAECGAKMWTVYELDDLYTKKFNFNLLRLQEFVNLTFKRA